jgi:hypothetical protein
LARASSGLLWESLEFQLSTAHLPRRRRSATATRGHRDDRASHDTHDCASSLLLVRSSSSATTAMKPPIQPSGLVPGWYWGAAAVAQHATLKMVCGCVCLLFIILIRCHVKVIAYPTTTILIIMTRSQECLIDQAKEASTSRGQRRDPRTAPTRGPHHQSASRPAVVLH